jgi:hypothetical protein
LGSGNCLHLAAYNALHLQPTMSKDFDQQLQAAKRWALAARGGGWLTEADIARLAGLDNRSPAGLFEPGAHRPLVAAFFGGTGVGKSSLLNRLAGQAIATVGVERPTSREVSVFLHDSLQLRQLPAGFPVDRVRVARHFDEKRRQILWIDMPDIDSTESSNRDLVADWLPHIDVLVYVVSPERYRDDKGWRLLREHVREHAWLFVLNHWDHGQEAQVADFIKLLRQGGFASPLVFRTDCREESQQRKPDEFAELESAIQTLADDHLIEQLERRALDARREGLQSAVLGCLARLGDAGATDGLRGQWTEIWQGSAEGLWQGLQWPMGEVARAFVQHDANPLRRSVKLGREEKTPEKKSTPKPSILWDDWAQMQLRDALDRLLVETCDRQLPVAPLQARLSGLVDAAPKLMTDEAQKGLRLALANPGNLVQRALLKFTALCSLLLPLVAMGWVSWQAVTAYYESALSHTGFLGVDFAIHSVLIIGIAWLLPFFLSQQIKPSHERTALKGLRNGVNAGLARIHVLADEALSAYATELDARLQDGRNLLNPPTVRQVAEHTLLGRIIPGEEILK